MNSVLFFDELSGLISDNRLQSRISAANKLKKNISAVFEQMYDDILAGNFLIEHDTEYYENQLRQAYIDAVSQMVDISDYNVVNHISDYSADVLNTTISKIAKAENSGVMLPESQIADGVSSAADTAINVAIVSALSAERAENIANNESLYVNNKSEYDGAVATGKSEHKWHSMEDFRVRPTHVTADLQVRPIDEPFNVGGYQLWFPTDTSLGAPPGETVNCRCYQTFS